MTKRTKRIDWQAVADHEFYTMDHDAQAQWAELRRKVR